MPVPKELIKSAFSEIHEALSGLGFDKRKQEILTKTISAETIGWIGLNKATGSGAGPLEINVVVGVRNQPLERLVAEMVGENYSDVIPPTLAGNIGYLSPMNKYKPFYFESVEGIRGTVADLCAEVRDSGLPFIQRVSELPSLINVMETARFGIPEPLAYRIPAGYKLMGDHAKASTYVEKRLAGLGDRTDPAAQRYRNFSARILASESAD